MGNNAQYARDEEVLRLCPVDPAIQKYFEEIVQDLRRIDDALEIHHVGSSALGFGLTAGNLDVQVRVAEHDFGRITSKLAQRFQVNPKWLRSSCSTAFEDNDRTLPLRLHLTVRGAKDDIQWLHTQELLLNESLRADYQRLKRAHEGRPIDAYGHAKQTFWEQHRAKVLWRDSGDEDRAKFVLSTERALRALSNDVPRMRKPEWMMWLELSSWEGEVDEKVTLQPVHEDEDWEVMRKLRAEIEREYRIEDTARVHGMVADIERKARAYQGTWFLAHTRGEVVGQIGVVPFSWDGHRVGRLQDVDIAPDMQGRGYGRAMLQTLTKWTQEQGYNALCLMALERDWPKDWYGRARFKKVGDTHPWNAALQLGPDDWGWR